jgi:hypothetical protein
MFGCLLVVFLSLVGQCIVCLFGECIVSYKKTIGIDNITSMLKLNRNTGNGKLWWEIERLLGAHILGRNVIKRVKMVCITELF